MHYQSMDTELPGMAEGARVGLCSVMCSQGQPSTMCRGTGEGLSPQASFMENKRHCFLESQGQEQGYGSGKNVNW